MKQIKFYFDQDEAVNMLESLVNEHSFTLNKKGVDKVSSLVKGCLKDLPLDWYTYKNQKFGDLLIAKSKIIEKKSPKILLSGHVDTVHKLKLAKFTKKKLIAYGPGVSDMKAGLVVIVWLLRNLHRNNLFTNITLTLVPDEEIGSVTHKEKLYEVYEKQDYGLVFESMHDNFESPKLINIVTERKGIAIYSMDIKGKSAHSGIATQKEKRISAILELAHKINDLEKLADYEKGTTLNVGVVVGGTTVNTIPKHAHAEFDVRYRTSKEMKRITFALSNLSNTFYVKHTKTTINNKVLIPPMISNTKSKIMLDITQQVALQMNMKFQIEKRAGGSDGNQISKFGVGVLDGFGPIGKGGHTRFERVYIPSIKTSSMFAFNTIKQLFERV